MISLLAGSFLFIYNTAQRGRNMHLIECGNFDIHISSEFYGDMDEFGTARQIRAHLECFFRRPLFKRIGELNCAKLNTKKIIVLKVHGTTKQGSRQYLYHDGENKLLVQDWINEHDGKASALVVMACNPHNYNVTSVKSLVLHPDRNVNLCDIIRGGVVRMFVPEIGYMEYNYYRLHKAIRELQK